MKITAIPFVAGSWGFYWVMNFAGSAVEPDFSIAVTIIFFILAITGTVDLI